MQVLDADTIVIEKEHWFDVSSSKDAFFTGRGPNDRHCAFSVINHNHIDGIHLFWDTLHMVPWIYALNSAPVGVVSDV